MGYAELILQQHGRDVEWLRRQADGSYQSQGLIKCLVQPAAPDEVFIEPGYVLQDYCKVYTAADLKHMDRLVFDGVTWEVSRPFRYVSEVLGEAYTVAVARRVIM